VQLLAQKVLSHETAQRSHDIDKHEGEGHVADSKAQPMAQRPEARPSGERVEERTHDAPW
jgi:hypothetical protein